MGCTIKNNMAQGLTLEQLQKMGGKPAGLTLQQLQAQQKPQESNLLDSLWSGLSGAGTQVAGAFNSGVAQAKQGYQDASVATNPLQKTEAGMKELAGAVNTVASPLAPLTAPIGKATAPVVDYLSNIPSFQKFAMSDAGKTASRIAEDVNNTATVAPVVIGGLGAGEIKSSVGNFKSSLDTQKGAGYVADTLKPKPVTPVETPIPSFKNPTDIKIQELISPKVSAKETKLALAEGRIAPGQEPGFLRDGTPDQVIPSEAIQKAAATIKKQIPGAESMTQPELHGALGVKIEEIATKLQPEMRKVPITDRVVNSITDAWDRLKTRQLEDPYASTGSNLEKLQKQFEDKFLTPLTHKVAEASMNGSLGVEGSSATMDDLWNTAKAYDQSVPQNVKSANVLSSDNLQTWKSVWIQNRAILRGAINDVSTGLGPKSKTAFDVMHDMYNAQKGIQSSYKVPKEGAPSTVKSALNSPTAKVIKRVAGAATIFEGGKRLLTGEF